MSRAPTKSGRPTARRPSAKRKQKKPSIIDRILAWLPISQHTLQRIATWSIFALAVGAALVVAQIFGIPGAVGTAVAEQAGNAGFRVEQIEIRGVKRMDQMTVYAVALEQKSRAMPLVDLNQIRDKLLQYGWVQDAHVSRRLPDTLLIRIVERTPAAVWQNEGTLSLIDRDEVSRTGVGGRDARSAAGDRSRRRSARAGLSDADDQRARAQAQGAGRDLGRQSPLGPVVRHRRDFVAAGGNR